VLDAEHCISYGTPAFRVDGKIVAGVGPPPGPGGAVPEPHPCLVPARTPTRRRDQLVRLSHQGMVPGHRSRQRHIKDSTRPGSTHIYGSDSNLDEVAGEAVIVTSLFSPRAGPVFTLRVSRPDSSASNEARIRTSFGKPGASRCVCTTQHCSVP